MQIIIKARYEAQNDEIHLDLRTADDRFVADACIDAPAQSFYFANLIDPQILNELPVLNAVHLSALIIDALVKATTPETLIAMCPDEPVTLDL